MGTTDSILNSVKKVLGVDPTYEAFDLDIIMHINTVLNVLNQMGVGTAGFTISDNTATWQQFIPSGYQVDMAKSYVCLRTRLLFDPPTNGTTTEAINRQISELEWRLFVNVDPSISLEEECSCLD